MIPGHQRIWRQRQRRLCQRRWRCWRRVPPGAATVPAVAPHRCTRCSPTLHRLPTCCQRLTSRLPAALLLGLFFGFVLECHCCYAARQTTILNCTVPRRPASLAPASVLLVAGFGQSSRRGRVRKCLEQYASRPEPTTGKQCVHSRYLQNRHRRPPGTADGHFEQGQPSHCANPLDVSFL